MSLVGPRPLLMKYLALYTPEEARRHEVQPGVTGWAQVNGRTAISWSQKFSYDVWYVDHATFWIDLRILLTTLKKIFKHEEVVTPGVATNDVFQGDVSRDPER